MHVFGAIVELGEEPLEVTVLQLDPDQSLQQLFEGFYQAPEYVNVRRLASVLVVRPPVARPLDPSIIEAIISGKREAPIVYGFLIGALATADDTFFRFRNTPIHLL